MDILEYVIKEALILIPVLYVIGMFIKSTPNVPSWIIPWIMLALGVIGATALVGFNVQGVIQGVLVAGVTVFANQLIQQTINK